MSPAVDPLAAELMQGSQNCSNVLLILPTEREPARICANEIDKTHPREAHRSHVRILNCQCVNHRSNTTSVTGDTKGERTSPLSSADNVCI